MNGSFFTNWDDPPSRDLHIHLWISFFCFPLNLERNWNDVSWGGPILFADGLVGFNHPKSERKKSLKSRRSPWLIWMDSCYPNKKIGANVSLVRLPKIHPSNPSFDFDLSRKRQVTKGLEKAGKTVERCGNVWKQRVWGPCVFFYVWKGAVNESGCFLFNILYHFTSMFGDSWSKFDEHINFANRLKKPPSSNGSFFCWGMIPDFLHLGDHNGSKIPISCLRNKAWNFQGVLGDGKFLNKKNRWTWQVRYTPEIQHSL